MTGNNISIDRMFDVLEQTCVSRGFLDCGSIFDSQYHYPLRSESYETYIIEVEQFTDCDFKQISCPW